MKRDNKQFGTLITLVLSIVFSLVLAIGANAQTTSASGTQTTNLNLSNAIELQFINGSGGVQNTTMSTISEMINGKELSDQDMRVRSNKPFKVTVAPATLNFTYTGTSIINNILSAASGINIKVTSNNTGGTAQGVWATLGSLLLPTTILNNCSAGGNQTFSVRYKTYGSATMAPGTYSIDVIYTATQL